MSEYAQERKGFWHEPSGTPTSETLALETWARLAYDVLSETAGTYHAVVRLEKLAARLQDESGVHTTRPPDRWMGKLLALVAVGCERNGDPSLVSLVVGATDDLPAARLRLECYRWAGSAPADGGVPAPLVTERVRRPRSPRDPSRPSRPSAGSGRGPAEQASAKPAAPRRVAQSDRPVTVCPTCFMAVPATGVCDNCG